MKCKFDLAWIGECGNYVEEKKAYCEEHLSLKCCVCKKQATHTCHETMGLVCGFPLCQDCTHNLNEEGVSCSGHSKKSEMKNKPWYLKEGI